MVIDSDETVQTVSSLIVIADGNINITDAS